VTPFSFDVLVIFVLDTFFGFLCALLQLVFPHVVMEGYQILMCILYIFNQTLYSHYVCTYSVFRCIVPCPYQIGFLNNVVIYIEETHAYFFALFYHIDFVAMHEHIPILYYSI
jgi:hypothetical protein